MDKETFEALEAIVAELHKSNKTNDFSYFILNSNPVRSNLVLLENWINTIAIKSN